MNSFKLLFDHYLGFIIILFLLLRLLFLVVVVRCWLLFASVVRFFLLLLLVALLLQSRHQLNLPSFQSLLLPIAVESPALSPLVQDPVAPEAGMITSPGLYPSGQATRVP
jgi:hypothetical protein